MSHDDEPQRVTDRLPEDRSWIDCTGLDRRKLLMTGAFAAGFAAACRPVSSSAVCSPFRSISRYTSMVSAAA